MLVPGRLPIPPEMLVSLQTCHPASPHHPLTRWAFPLEAAFWRCSVFLGAFLLQLGVFRWFSNCSSSLPLCDTGRQEPAKTIPSHSPPCEGLSTSWKHLMSLSCREKGNSGHRGLLLPIPSAGKQKCQWDEYSLSASECVVRPERLLFPEWGCFFKLCLGANLNEKKDNCIVFGQRQSPCGNRARLVLLCVVFRCCCFLSSPQAFLLEL